MREPFLLLRELFPSISDNLVCRIMGGCQTDDKKSTNQQTSCEGSTQAIQKANSKPILALEKRKANLRKAKAMDIVSAAGYGRVADVQLVCQYAPEKVNDMNRVSCCCTPTHC